MKILVALVFLAAMLASAPAGAAFKSSADAPDADAAWNPQPRQDDIVLPMPCGQSLALRAVAVPSGALIRDKSFPMGIASERNQERQIYERQFTGHIAAPFRLADLPGAWRQKLDAAQKNASEDAWYFIGKYEISRAQWEAVTDALDRDGSENPALCPKPARKGANLPVTGISWFETQEFLNKYNAWLVKTHKGDLPAFANTQNVAYLRLPTEEEWEYAARGGNRVPPEWWADKDIFPFEEGKSLKDYAVTSDQGALQNPLGIGSRGANPLGLHDTAGNVDEMVDGFFRMSIADMANGQVIRRLHGAAGGIITKGGGFRSFREAVMPGARDEVALYTANGPMRRADLGFRVALAAINIPSAKRLTELRKEAGSQTFEEKPGKEIEGDTPLEMIESMTASADATTKANLLRLRELLNDQQAARTSQDLKNLEQAFRSALYQSETLRAFAFRYAQATKMVDKLKNTLAEDLTKEERARAKAGLSEAERQLRDYMESLRMGTSHYKLSLEMLSSQPHREIGRLARQMKQEYGGSGIFDDHMRGNIDVLLKYLDIFRKRGPAALDTRTILHGILPEIHYKKLNL